MKLLKTSESKFVVDAYPPNCPRCKRLISADFSGILSEKDNGCVESVFKCPNCQSLFIGVYGPSFHSQNNLQFVLPHTPVERCFPLVHLISERFAEIFNQAVAAEEYGLADIAGSGYRKALEFLIKDFCIALHPDDALQIRKKFLKSVIDDHLDSGKLQRAATLTTWLGNDEGHYERRWIDKDLTDLKALLNLTLALVEEEVQLEQYLHSMRPDSPKRIHLRVIE